jgi:murein DD-endopeptidase MepM/ murein hydrolase activator NlpD
MRLPNSPTSRALFSVVLSVILLCAHLVAPLPSAAQDDAPSVTIYVVQRGDTLFRIAQAAGTSVEQLAQLNGIADPGSIQVGDRLLVPSAETVSAAPPAALTSEVFHVVLPGETLFRIATQYGTTVNAVTGANSIGDASLIYPGQTLLIPGVQPPQLMTERPALVSGLSVQPQVFTTGRTGMVRVTTVIAATASGTVLGLPLVAGSEDGGLTHTLLVGIPIDSPVGMAELALTFTDAAGGTSMVLLNVQVVSGQFATESLTIPDDRLALLGADVDAAEAEMVRSVMSGRSPDRLFSGLMGLSAAAAVTSAFGATRSYNGGILQRLHLGTDFGGAPGTSIFAPADGVVVFSGPLEVRGLATILDHGWGVYTGYWHQTETYVAPGDRVVPGQVIGTIGMSGRATGPHLHWELWVNGVPVDPMQWVQQAFSP